MHTDVCYRADGWIAFQFSIVWLSASIMLYLAVELATAL